MSDFGNRRLIFTITYLIEEYLKKTGFDITGYHERIRRKFGFSYKDTKSQLNTKGKRGLSDDVLHPEAGQIKSLLEGLYVIQTWK
jgi:hypothetical protein